ncbi:hypothetical protein FACS189413_00060 [Bacteroidia bacterium]|nr:hypothetical protein FACS189413_00060 [Bacteroidia bacterium]
MRKTVLFIFFGCISWSLFAEVSTKWCVDSVIVENQSERHIEKIAFEYAVFGQIASEMRYIRPDLQTAWIPNRKSEYHYNNQRNEISVISSVFQPAIQTWKTSGKSETQYNNGIITTAYSMDAQQQNWLPLWKSEINQNECRFYQRQNNDWLPTDKYIDQTHESAAYKWNATSQTWNPAYSSEYAYDAGGRLLIATLYLQNRNQEAVFVRYDAENRLSSEIRYQWNETRKDWTEQRQIEYLYDENNRLQTLIESSWDEKQNAWNNRQRTEYQYGADHDFPVSVSVFDWDKLETSSVVYSYFYSQKTFSSIPELPENQSRFSIYPNPVYQYFQVSGIADNSWLMISDMSGKRLLNRFINDGESVPAQFLPEGTYIVTLRTGKNTVSQKIIKK